MRFLSATPDGMINIMDRSKMTIQFGQFTLVGCALLGLSIIVLAGCKSPQVAYQELCQTSPHFSDSQYSPIETNLPNSVTPQFATETSIEEYVQIGLEQNPRIREAELRIEALTHRIPQVTSLPDPMVNTTTYLAPIETAAGQQEFAIGINQKIVRAERRATQAAIVSDEISAARCELADLRLEIAESIRSSCYQLLFVQKAIEITREDIESLARIADDILNLYEVKKSVSQQDVLNVQLEQSRVENELSELIQQEKSNRARLARLLHINPGAEFSIADTPSPTNEAFDLELLVARAIETRPDLQSQLSKIRQNRKKIQLAELEGIPDVTVGLNWIMTSSNGLSRVANGDDAVLLGVGFNWPIYQDRIRAGICEAKATSLASAVRYESLVDQASEEIFDSVAKVESSREMLNLMREDIIPKSERTLNLSIEEYANGRSDYIQLISNWRAVLRYRIAEARIQTDLDQAMVSLNRSIGSFDSLPSIGVDPSAIVQPLDWESTDAGPSEDQTPPDPNE